MMDLGRIINYKYYNVVNTDNFMYIVYWLKVDINIIKEDYL